MRAASKRPPAVLIACCLSLAMSAPAGAEAFRVRQTVMLPLSPAGERTSVSAGADDALVIQLPEDAEFIQGVEVSIKVPQELAARKGCAVWTLYDEVTPLPREDVRDYTGVVSSTGTFGASLSLNMQIPLYQDNSIKRDAYSHYVEALPDATDGKIFLRLRLEGRTQKGAEAALEVSARPIFVNQGRLVLDVTAPEGAAPRPYAVFVDGQPVDAAAGPLPLLPGLHDVSLVSDYYRNEARTIHVEQAKTATVSVRLRSISPLLRLVAPADAAATVDGVAAPALNTFFPVAPGSHTVRITIGDYEVVKKVSAVNGRNYTMAVTIDAVVAEEE